jgi:DNA-binding HxlR family transcriptional regulator
MRKLGNRSRESNGKVVGGISRIRTRPAGRVNGNGVATKQRPDKRNGTHLQAARTLFPEVAKKKNRFGMGVLLAVVERQGADAELGFARVGRFHSTPGQRPKAGILGSLDAGNVAKMLAGLAHPDRIRILRAILQGAATHFALHKAVGLKTGPLYHHLRALERSGVLTVATRNTYELTELGKITLLVTHTLGTAFSKKGQSWTNQRMSCECG